MEALGLHMHTETLSMKDINGLTMVKCVDCDACAHAINEEKAKEDLAKTACSPDCENCKKLRHSYDRNPAVPQGGSCNDVYHICPNDGNRWWQFNAHFHLWEQVTDRREWNAVI